MWTIWDVVIDVRVLQLRVDTHRQWMLLSLMLPVYRAGGAMVLMTFLWAGCLQAWKTARINYLYMFDLDQVLGLGLGLGARVRVDRAES